MHYHFQQTTVISQGAHKKHNAGLPDHGGCYTSAWTATRGRAPKRAKMPRGRGRRFTATPSEVDQTYEGEIHRCLRSERRRVGRRCFTWYSRDACDARGSLVGRKHERFCRRMTGQCSTTGQRQDAVTDGPKYRRSSRYRHRRPCHQPALFSWSGGCCKRTCKPSTGNVTRTHSWGTLRPTTTTERRREAQEDALLNVIYSAIALLICAALAFETLT